MTELKIDQRREFGDCIADGFKILGNNFKAFIVAFLIYVFPLVIITSLLLYYFGKPILAEGIESNLTTMPYVLLSMYGGMLLGVIMLSAIVYAIFQAYLENGNSQVRFEEIQPYILNNFWLIIPVYIANIIILIVPAIAISALSAISSVFIILFVAYFIGMIYLVVPLFIAPFVRVYEERGIIESITRSIQIVKDNWWPTFGVIFISNLISSMAASIIWMPLYMVTFFKAFSGLDGGLNGSEIGFWAGLTMLVGFLASLFATAYYLAATLLKYFDLVEKKEGYGLLEKIDQFGNDTESVFENEGEF